MSSSFHPTPMPSMVPSNNSSPSALPTESMEPSLSPGESPSTAPTESQKPSSLPSFEPTIIPSAVPSVKPTVMASSTPSIDPEKQYGWGGLMAPEIDRNGNKSLGFLWHLWYSPDAKWAERGYDYCVMCRHDECKENDYVVTSHCNANKDHFRWEWLFINATEGENVGMMKTKTKNLCLEGNGSAEWNFTLGHCDADNEGQHFKGMDLSGERFKLMPKAHQPQNNSQCMTMHHHPLAARRTDGERIKSQWCWIAEKTDTAYWTADYRPRIPEELTRKPTCSSERPCGECVGTCQEDSDCENGLFCYKRGNKGWRTNLKMRVDPNPYAKIPGCTGIGLYGENYCSARPYVSPYTEKKIEAILDR